MPNEKGTTVYALQKKFQSMFGFTLPLFHGRGLLNCALYTIPYPFLPVDALIPHLPFVDNLGLMPYRRRIVSVSESFCDFQILHLQTLTSTVGRPIHTQQCDRPSIEEVTRVQTLYIEELTRSVRFFRCGLSSRPSLDSHRIWNTYKDEFAKTRTRELSIID